MDYILSGQFSTEHRHMDRAGIHDDIHDNMTTKKITTTVVSDIFDRQESDNESIINIYRQLQPRY